MGKGSRVPKSAVLVVVVLALALRLLYFFLHPSGYDQNVIHTADGHDYDTLAKSLIAGEGLAWDGHATSVIPPIYPFFIRICYGLFGVDVFAVRLVQIVLSVLTCLLLWAWARRLLGEWGGLFVLCASAFYYPYIQMPCYIMTETLFLFFMALILFLTAHVDSRRGLHLAAALGVLAGLAMLTRPTALAIVCIVPFLIWRSAGPSKGRCVLVFLLLAVLVWLPWPARNYVVHHAFVPFSTNGGLNLYRGNNPNATGGSGGWNRQGPDTGPLPKTGHMSEVEADRYLKGLASDFVRHHPVTYAKLCAKRAVNLWRPYYDNARNIGKLFMFLSDVLLYPFALLGAVMAVAMKQKKWVRTEQAWFLLALFLLFNVFYISAITVIRYRYPIMPVVMLFAAVGLLHVLKTHAARPAEV